MLTEEQRASWNDQGFLHLPGFFQEPAVSAINEVVEQAWRQRPRHIVVDDLTVSRRCRLADLSLADRAHFLKLNDLYLRSEALRSAALEPRLVSIAGFLLGDQPVLCNTLNLERSSQQDYHADSLYMTPLSEDALVAAWIALEAAEPDSGPLTFYPASHKIPCFQFSSGRHAVASEMPRWAEHMREQIAARGLVPRSLLAQPGDLFLWHANLLHGAERVRAAGATRRSLVCHYFTLGDCRSAGYRLRATGGGHWIDRAPQPVSRWDRIRVGLSRRLFEPLRSWAHRRAGATWRAAPSLCD